MKKISTILGILLVCVLAFSSCHEDVENWDSAVLDYSGRYVFRILDETGENAYTDYDGSELQIYNTAANVTNELWIDDLRAAFPMKSKFVLEGSPASFKSIETDFDKLTDNQYVSGPKADPTAEGEETTVDDNYLKATILDGKITKGGYTTPAGNVTDAIRMTIRLYSGVMTYTSYTKPKDSWVNPNTPEYAWRLTGVEYVSDWDETYVIEGYRYTGFDEDQF